MIHGSNANRFKNILHYATTSKLPPNNWVSIARCYDWNSDQPRSSLTNRKSIYDHNLEQDVYNWHKPVHQLRFHKTISLRRAPDVTMKAILRTELINYVSWLNWSEIVHFDRSFGNESMPRKPTNSQIWNTRRFLMARLGSCSAVYDQEMKDCDLWPLLIDSLAVFLISRLTLLVPPVSLIGQCPSSWSFISSEAPLLSFSWEKNEKEAHSYQLNTHSRESNWQSGQCAGGEGLSTTSSMAASTKLLLETWL